MVQLNDLFDRELYKQRLIERYIRVQSHPTQPLNIINYTELAQYANLWDEVTLQCRGLIYNTETEEVVARPFKKFHNWDDGRQPYPPAGPLIRAPKMDGSLGILYPCDDAKYGWAVATRGSFTSDQAVFASALLNRWVEEGKIRIADLNVGKTYLTEIIY